MFLNLEDKNTQTKHFWSQIYGFSHFHEILHLETFDDADFKYDNNFFIILAPKYPTKAFLVPFLAFFFFPKILQLGIFEGADLKNENICL